jgi:hypothetical protein
VGQVEPGGAGFVEVGERAFLEFDGAIDIAGNEARVVDDAIFDVPRPRPVGRAGEGEGLGLRPFRGLSQLVRNWSNSVSLSFECRYVRWQADSHKESRQSLRKMLEVWWLQSPPFFQRCGVTFEVIERQTNDVSKVNDKAFAIVLCIVDACEQVQGCSLSFSYLFPFILSSELWIAIFHLRQSRGDTESNDVRLVVNQVATLGHNNEPRWLGDSLRSLPI